MLTALLLLVALLTAPVIPVAAPQLEIRPWLRAKDENFTVYLYASYEDSQCPRQEDVDEILGVRLQQAMQLHREAMLRFVGEFGFQYEKLLLLKFELTNDKKKAGVIINVKDLENVGGTTMFRVSDNELKPALVTYDCDIANLTPGGTITVILHELYHTLGLGHPDKGNQYELMGGANLKLMKPTYPSSLDAFGLWEIWFSGKYSGQPPSNNFFYSEMFSINEPYLLLEPFNETIVKLIEQSRELEDRNKRLTSENFDLRNDIVRLRDEVSSYKAQVQSLEGQLEEKSKTISLLNETVSSLRNSLEAREATIGSLNETINNLKAELSNASARISGLESQISALMSVKSSLEAENALLRTKIDTLQQILIAITVSFTCILVAVVWKMRKK